jgi:hypothetical protein
LATFAVKPGHEIAAVERVVAKHDGYDIVEKRPGPAADEAEETDDPRSQDRSPSACLQGLLDGPAWIRTRDRRIMSPVL